MRFHLSQILEDPLKMALLDAQSEFKTNLYHREGSDRRAPAVNYFLILIGGIFSIF
jgi:hypothetical protein